MLADDCMEVERRLAEFIGRGGAAAEQLAARAYPSEAAQPRSRRHGDRRVHGAAALKEAWLDLQSEVRADHISNVSLEMNDILDICSPGANLARELEDKSKDYA